MNDIEPIDMKDVGELIPPVDLEVPPIDLKGGSGGGGGSG